MSPRQCTVKGCNSSKKKLYRIPKDCSEEWSEVINYGKPLLWRPKKCTVICELHFKSTDFSGPGKHHLLPSAIPQSCCADLPPPHPLSTG